MRILKFPFLGDISDRPNKPKPKSFLSASNMKPAKNKITLCPCCRKTNHSLDRCYFFIKKSMSDREQFVRKNKICFGCLQSDSHRSEECKGRLICTICSKFHPTALHKDEQVASQRAGSKVELEISR